MLQPLQTATARVFIGTNITLEGNALEVSLFILPSIQKLYLYEEL